MLPVEGMLADEDDAVDPVVDERTMLLLLFPAPVQLEGDKSPLVPPISSGSIIRLPTDDEEGAAAADDGDVDVVDAVAFAAAAAEGAVHDEDVMVGELLVE